MNAPATIESQSDGVVRWLTNETRDERFVDNIFAELCIRLQRAGIPIKRATMNLLIQHPQWLGARIVWSDGMREAEITRIDYDTGEIVYNMGFESPSGEDDFGHNLFSFQHAPQMLPNGNMMVYDNGNRRDGIDHDTAGERLEIVADQQFLVRVEVIRLLIGLAVRQLELAGRQLRIAIRRVAGRAGRVGDAISRIHARHGPERMDVHLVVDDRTAGPGAR